MPRFTITHDVVHARGAGPSGRALARALRGRGYSGAMINWGVASMQSIFEPDCVNEPEAVARASNKRVALEVMRAAGVSCPRSVGWPVDTDHGPVYPCVARTDRHRAGAGLWLCDTEAEYLAALAAGASHAMEFIAGERVREFRCHIAFGRSIKLTEKLWRGEGAADSTTRTHGTGWVQVAPAPHAFKRHIRVESKAAVEALGLDFGAVDVITRLDEPDAEGVGRGLEVFVLEVNTAPRLVDPNTDTLLRYCSAFLAHGMEDAS